MSAKVVSSVVFFGLKIGVFSINSNSNSSSLTSATLMFAFFGCVSRVIGASAARFLFRRLSRPPCRSEAFLKNRLTELPTLSFVLSGNFSRTISEKWRVKIKFKHAYHAVESGLYQNAPVYLSCLHISYLQFTNQKPITFL